MELCTTVKLSGDNLGHRHKNLNFLVRDTTDRGAAFEDVEALPELTPVDRLFKIDVAIKLKNIDYIIRNLKDNNMLYVSRALKSTWLLDHHEIINPQYLEDVLFPEMVTPAVSKMKHWLYINLRNPSTCEEFYNFYNENVFEYAIKFLFRCTNEFILNEVPKILPKILTHHLKILSVKCPKVAKIYFDSLSTDEAVIARYLGKEQAYYNSVKCILKSDADVFLDITEKYFNLGSFSSLSSSATDYILRYHKNRFSNKLELYVAYLMNIPTLASRLSVEECQDVVIKLARAKYLQNWFEYKVVEPLIKRISPDKRAAFKTRVFVEKNVGEQVDEWPYATPASPTCSDPSPHVFDDHDFLPIRKKFLKRLLKKRKGPRYECDYIIESCMPLKSDLDRLFDEFRFIGFDRALHDLGLRLGTAGSADRRRDIFLVLVSKSGGRSDAVSALLRLAVRHRNEPAHTRAAVLRSLVKRANVWRLPADVWQHLLDFGHGLGLDGGTSEAECPEGFHAVVIRQLLAGECEPQIRKVFLDDFSTLAEYSLTVDERGSVAVGLQNILVTAATDVEPEVAAKYLGQLLNLLDLYHIGIEPESPAIKAIMALALQDTEIALPLLEWLYNARVARREFFRLNLKFRQNEAALLNALRHDPSALELSQVVKIFAAGNSSSDRFVSKLTIYFNEKEGFATMLRAAVKEKISEEFNVKLVRPLATLLSNDLEMELRNLDAVGLEQAKFAAALRACAHRSRPINYVAKWGWRMAGVKAIATWAMRCRDVERTELIRALATERRTVRVALALSMRSTGELMLETFESTATLRPAAVMRTAMLYFRHRGPRSDPRVWHFVKPLISSIDLSSRRNLCHLLKNTDWTPSTIKPDYCATLYLAMEKNHNSSDDLLQELTKILPEVNIESIENILLHILDIDDEAMLVLSCPAIFIRYLMLSRNDEDLKRRFDKIGERFLDRLDALRCEKDSHFPKRLNQIMESLKYNAAFLDTKYTSCLSVIEKILFWMQKFMPKGEYFKQFVQVHLTMIYFKAVRQSMKQMPEVFGDPKRKLSEGVEAVGFVFGRYVVKEVAELVRTYFDSIIDLYTGPLVDYLGNYFMFGSAKARFLGCILKGMMAEEGSHRRMAVTVLRDCGYVMENDMRKEIEESMMQDKAIEFFAHAELLSYGF